MLRRKRADDDVVEQGQARESSHDLEGAPDSRPADCERRLADELAAVELDAAGTGDDEAVERVEERRLAGAVGSDDAEDLALADLERNLLQRAEPSETHRHVVHGEQGFRIHRPLPVEGKVRGVTEITDVFDKGKDKGALVLTRQNVENCATGVPRKVNACPAPGSTPATTSARTRP